MNYQDSRGAHSGFQLFNCFLLISQVMITSSSYADCLKFAVHNVDVRLRVIVFVLDIGVEQCIIRVKHFILNFNKLTLEHQTLQ